LIILIYVVFFLRTSCFAAVVHLRRKKAKYNGQGVKAYVCIMLNYQKSFIGLVTGIAQIYLPSTHISTNGMSLYFQPPSVTALWPELISRPTQGKRLSWPGRGFDSRSGCVCLTTLSRLLVQVTPLCPCHQAVQFGSG